MMIEAVFLALAPIVVMTGLGIWLRRRSFLDERFWPQAERLSYFILLPSLFFHGVATADLESLPVMRLALTLILSTLAVAAIVMALKPFMKVDGPAFTSVFQGSIRFNNYVGVTLAAGLLGSQGVALAAICNAAIVPTVNILCVLVFARYGSARLDVYGVMKQLVTNPLLIASLAGIAFKALDLGIPAGIEPAFRALGAAALPVGLICVGAALDFTVARRWSGPVALSSLMKFLVMPIMTDLVASSAGLQGAALRTALLFQVLPTASSAYILAKQLGGDAPLMAGITAAQTIMALVAIPLVFIGLNGWIVM